MRDSQHFWFLASSAAGTVATFSAGETRHAVKVLRAAKGTELTATDGTGYLFHCRIVSVTRDGMTAEILEKREEPLPPGPPVTLMVGLPDKDHFEQLLANVVPFGVDRIVPVVCTACQKPWWHKWDKQTGRLFRIVESAAKQSHNPRLPVLEQPRPFAQIDFADGNTLVADETGTVTTLPSDRPTTLWIGPPGGFTEMELAVLHEKGAQSVTFGPYRLRTELAAATAMALVRRNAVTTQQKSQE